MLWMLIHTPNFFLSERLVSAPESYLMKQNIYLFGKTFDDFSRLGKLSYLAFFTFSPLHLNFWNVLKFPLHQSALDINLIEAFLLGKPPN